MSVIHALAVLLLSSPIHRADRPEPAAQTVVAQDLARLRASEAERLEGKRAVYRVVLDSLPDWHKGFVLYDCQSTDDIGRTVWLEGGQHLAEEMAVEATLFILRHAGAVGSDGTIFAGFTEYRLVGAVRRF